MEGFIFRKAKQNDIAACTYIYNRIADEETAGNMTVGWVRDIYPTIETAATALNANELFVCEYKGKVIASAVINKQQVDVYNNVKWLETADANENEIMVMHTLSVLPDEQGNGCGTAFVNFYEDYAAAHGCRNLRIDTNALNTRARGLYKKLGYIEAGTEHCTFNDIRGIDLVCLEKRLPCCIRRYSPKDKENVRFICRATADKIFKLNDKTRTAVTTVYNDYFTEQEPEHVFVLADARDCAVGYIICCASLTKFEKCMKSIYIPKLAKSCPLLIPVGWFSLFSAREMKGCPHLHMDILPEYQRQGWGTKLMNALRTQLNEEGYKYLSVCGAAIGSPGHRMYTRYGFRKAKHSFVNRVSLIIETEQL